MFGDMFGNMEEKQKELRAKLATIIVEADADNGAVKVSANANREITNITIDRAKIDVEDLEQVEDLVMAAVNRALLLAAEKEAEGSQSLLKDMLPPGMGDLPNIFG
ncbi:MAG: YbaB/EbfC family nucleoid-associated protein [Saprospiraceae bacterium]